MEPRSTDTARTPWPLILSAAAILMITMGTRQSLGLFVAPLGAATGLGIVHISFALAVGQFVWGAVQPLFGAVADQYGAGRVLVLGTAMLALGLAATPFAHSQFALLGTLGVLAAAGAGAGSFSILIGATAARLPAAKRSFASGLINAGGSMGQFVFAPAAQALITAYGWIHALFALAASSALTLPLIAGLAPAQPPLPRRRRPAPREPCAPSCMRPCGTAATCCSTPASSPAGCTSHSW